MMMEVKHTPGPWVVQDGDRFSMEMVITSQRRIEESMAPICEMDVDYDGEHGEEQHANAKLIAAAPELLEALIALHAVASIDRDKDYSTVTNAAAIIAKATS
jgi:hypothetical protein